MAIALTGSEQRLSYNCRGWPWDRQVSLPFQLQPHCPHKVKPKLCSQGHEHWVGQETGAIPPLTRPLEPSFCGEVALEHPIPLLTSSNRPAGPDPLSLPPSWTVTHPERMISKKGSFRLPAILRNALGPHRTPSKIYPKSCVKVGDCGSDLPRQSGISYQLHCLDLLEHGD